MYQSVLHPTLYTPATMALGKLEPLVNGDYEHSGIWRLVVCTEDSVLEEDVPYALENLGKLLAHTADDTPVCNFVRVRNPDVLKRVLELDGIEKVEGFVIPKVTTDNFPAYASQLLGTKFRLLPILETVETLEQSFRNDLRAMFLDPVYRDRIDCVRIGGNDLMGLLGMRRSTSDDDMIYDTPVGNVILDVIQEFRGISGFEVTAPVFECYAPCYDDPFRKEVKKHVFNQLLGQTVIQPRHMRMLRDLYKVRKKDLTSAQRMIDDANAKEKAKAVRGLHGRMDEPTTHLSWAKRIIERYDLFGDDETTETWAESFGKIKQV